jgi:ABC-2 type transport system permease protein
MDKELRFVICAIKKNIESSAELRTSFLASIVGMMINNTSFIILWIFFIQSVGVINGWTAADIIGLHGFVAIAYGTIFSVAAGVRQTASFVSQGVFDRFMLSPKNLLLRVATASFGVSAVGDILFGFICLIFYMVLINAGLQQIMLMLALCITSTIVFLAMSILFSAASFLFVDSNDLVSGLFEIFFTPAMFHGGAFQGTMRFVFTFLVPSLLVGTLPVETAKSLSIASLALITVLSVAWLFIAIKLFNLGVRKYESTNFVTFGN